MAFNGLLTLVSDCNTVMINGTVKSFAVDCSCQVLGLQNGLPKGQCTSAAMMWLAQMGNISLAPIHNIGNLSNSQVSQSTKSYKLGFNEVMLLHCPSHYREWRSFGRLLNSYSCFVCSKVFRSRVLHVAKSE
jgi:hypothetical protein